MYNSGFVGWLACWLKRELGTGVVVVCGQNSRRGGVYDYWGCPAHLCEQATAFSTSPEPLLREAPSGRPVEDRLLGRGLEVVGAQGRAG